jgi:hypothetical protein
VTSPARECAGFLFGLATLAGVACAHNEKAPAQTGAVGGNHR